MRRIIGGIAFAECPSHYLVVAQADRAAPQRYWQLPTSTQAISLDEAIERFDRVLFDAVLL